MKRFLVAAALVLAAGRGWAADLPQPAPPPPQAPAAYIPAPAPVYNWGGVYFGINGGYGFGSSSWTAGTGATSGSFDVSGYAVGATIGANMQFDAFVIGIDGDFDAMGTDGTSGNVNCPVNCETKNTWLSTLRGRIGFAVDRVLFYGTAGGAFGNIQGNTSGTTFQSSTEPGWTAGAGVEVAIGDNWTARAEYLFVDLENASLATTAGASNITVKLDENLVRLGIDYKFH